MVVSGSCIGAHKTAVYFALHSLGAKTVLISLMATVSALPYTLFTLPAGAIADMVDRKKILLGVQFWHAFIAIALAVLWMTHLLNPYLILASAFLFSAQLAMYSRMTPYKLERNTINGKALYTYANKQKGVVYIGGDKAYQRYRQLARQQSIGEKELEASYSNYLQNIDQIYSINYD